MKKTVIFVMLFYCFFGSVFAESDPWGELKKIYFYNSVGKDDQALERLHSINIPRIKRSDQEEIAQAFTNLGDHYVTLKKFAIAEQFYRRVLEISPDYWFVYNRLENISRLKGGFLFNLRITFRQFSMLLKDFETSYLLLNSFFNTLFFAFLLILFILSIIQFVHYFNLAGNDLLGHQGSHFSIAKIVYMALLMLWPLLMLSGWSAYPFLIMGFMWVYFSEKEKKSTVFLLILIAIGSLLYSFSMVLKDNYQTDSFRTTKQVFAGHLFERRDYEKFDPEMKVLQAFSYYEHGQLKTAEDILRSTGKGYQSKLKYILLGNIYFKFENISESIKFFQMALSIDDTSKIALNNFTMVLLKNNNPDVFKSWAKRYTEIDEYKNNELYLQEIKLSQIYLWRRMLSLNKPDFSIWNLSGSILKKFFSLPVVYYLLIFLIYIFSVPKLFSQLGKSTYCSKCSKIIKKASVHKSYKLCNDCYQLFMIKDVIFLEAKILKEKELSKKSRRKSIFILFFSLIVPGLKLVFSNQQRRFIMFSGLFYFLTGYFLVSFITMKNAFSNTPIFIHFIGGLAILLYFALNIYALWGDENGF